MSKRTLLFSLSNKDFIVQPFKASGNGGQKRNKTMSACRIIHPASGARAEAVEQRSFFQNKRVAFERLVEKEEFKKWHRIATAKAMGTWVDIDAEVDKAMDWKNIRIEVQQDGRWVEVKPDEIKYEDVFEDD